MPSRAWVVTDKALQKQRERAVSMPSRAWVVTQTHNRDYFKEDSFNALSGLSCYEQKAEYLQGMIGFNALSGLSCYVDRRWVEQCVHIVSMPSRAWVVTARMPDILNFSWYFLCIPAIYRCILAHLPIFFNQLSKFLRCESPSTFLGTCLSHHSFIIFLVTNTNTLLSGLYLISTALSVAEKIYNLHVSMPSRAYTSFLRYLQWHMMQCITMCQCPLGLIPHFYTGRN